MFKRETSNIAPMTYLRFFTPHWNHAVACPSPVFMFFIVTAPHGGKASGSLALKDDAMEPQKAAMRTPPIEAALKEIVASFL